MTTAEDFEKLTRDNAEAATRAFGILAKGLQGIAGEIADYSKASFEAGSATLERLTTVRSLDRVIEIETDGVDRAWRDFVAHSARIGGLWGDLLKDVTARPASPPGE